MNISTDPVIVFASGFCKTNQKWNLDLLSLIFANFKRENGYVSFMNSLKDSFSIYEDGSIFFEITRSTGMIFDDVNDLLKNFVLMLQIFLGIKDLQYNISITTQLSEEFMSSTKSLDEVAISLSDYFTDFSVLEGVIYINVGDGNLITVYPALLHDTIVGFNIRSPDKRAESELKTLKMLL